MELPASAAPSTGEPGFIASTLSDVLEAFYEKKRVGLMSDLTNVLERAWRGQAGDVERRVKQVVDEVIRDKKDDLTRVLADAAKRTIDDEVVHERAKQLLGELIQEHEKELVTMLATSARKTIDDSLDEWLRSTLKTARASVATSILTYIAGFASVSAIYWILQKLLG